MQIVTAIERGDQVSGQSRAIFLRQFLRFGLELENIPVHALRLYAAGEERINTSFRCLSPESALPSICRFRLMKGSVC
jgi:hypothetical protein